MKYLRKRRSTVAARMLRFAVFVVAAGLLGPSLLAQTTRNVPGSYPSIQAAINVSNDGDTVLVAPGSYLEHVDFLGKAIELRSSGGRAVTTIRGGGTGPVLLLDQVQGPCSVRGFTIRDGLGSLPDALGGGLSAKSCTDVTIAECIIRDNVGVSTPDGVFSGAGGLDVKSCEYLVENCVIIGNQGADTPDLENTRGGPGGVWLWSSRGTIRNCRIANNRGGDGASTVGSTRGGDGGLSAKSSGEPQLVVECSIEANEGGTTVTSHGSTFGGTGGIDLLGWPLRIERCSVVGNIGASDGPGPGVGGAGGMTLRGPAGNTLPPIEVHDCLVVENTGGDIGNTLQIGGKGGPGGARLYTSVRLANCTIAVNLGGSVGAGGVVFAGGLSILENCIVWGNDGWGMNRDQLEHDVGTPIVEFCDVEGSWPGVGNLDIDPSFADPVRGDFSLGCGSPVIDQGVAVPGQSTSDLAGNPRVIGDQVDMGAYEFVPEVFPNYCASVPNSSGASADIEAVGCHSIGTNQLTLRVSGLPGTPGLFFYGPNQLQVTFGNGFRCVGGALRRTPPMPGTGAIFEKQLDLGALDISAGATTNFQYWFRDVAAGGSQFNLSNGLQVDFEP